MPADRCCCRGRCRSQIARWQPPPLLPAASASRIAASKQALYLYGCFCSISSFATVCPLLSLPSTRSGGSAAVADAADAAAAGGEDWSSENLDVVLLTERQRPDGSPAYVVYRNGGVVDAAELEQLCDKVGRRAEGGARKGDGRGGTTELALPKGW